MATLYLKAASVNWNDAASWSTVNASGGDNSGPPTAADNCIAELLSGNVTIAATAACRSFDTTSGTGSWGGTLTHNAGIPWNIGDGTAGAGNVALKFNSGITYSPGSSASTIAFVSTSATQQTITWAGKSHAGLTFNGVGGSWIFSDASTQAGTSSVVTLTNGTFNTGNQTCSWVSFFSNNSNTRTLTLGSSAITVSAPAATIAVSWDVNVATGLTLSAGTSTITLSGSNQTFRGAPATYNTVVLSGSGSATIGNATGVSTFANLTRTGTATKTDSFYSYTCVVTGVLTVSGNSITNRMFWAGHGTLGSRRTITNTGATVTCSNIDVRDVGLSSAADLSAITGGSGDCGGNSGITFTPAAPKYWVGDGGDWASGAATHWALSSGGAPGANNLPLPQDDVYFDVNSFSLAGQTVTCDMPRLGNSVSFLGVTNSPTFTPSGTFTVYGSLTFISAMTYNANTTIFEGRGAYSYTSGGKSSSNVTVQMVGGTLTLTDAVTLPGGSFKVSNGTLNCGSFSHSIYSFDSNNSNVRAVNLESATITVGNNAGTATVWDFATTTNLTFDSGTSTIKFSSTDGSLKTFIGGAKTYNNLTYTGTGSSVRYISGSNTFNQVTNDNAGTTFGIRFSAFGAVHTVTTLGLTGASGNVITIDTNSAGSAATLSSPSGTNTATYCSIKDSAATGGATWNAYACTNVSGNSGWNFLSIPTRSAGMSLLGCGT